MSTFEVGFNLHKKLIKRRWVGNRSIVVPDSTPLTMDKKHHRTVILIKLFVSSVVKQLDEQASVFKDAVFYQVDDVLFTLRAQQSFGIF